MIRMETIYEEHVFVPVDEEESLVCATLAWLEQALSCLSGLGAVTTAARCIN